jgi:cation diffusion facilitator CzcD-associated flavoprotein CzcO
VVTAVGQLHHPKIPIFHGVEKFQGSMVHTAKFGSRQLRDYIDKNVAVIGSGASAVQLIPELQKVCKNVYVFQRTPNFIAPKLSLNPTLQKIINTFTFLKWLYRRVYLEQIGEIVLLGAINGTQWAKALLMAQCFDNMKQNIQDESLQKELTPTYPIGAKRI